jgi:hypothetical protein
VFADAPENQHESTHWHLSHPSRDARPTCSQAAFSCCNQAESLFFLFMPLVRRIKHPRRRLPAMTVIVLLYFHSTRLKAIRRSVGRNQIVLERRKKEALPKAKGIKVERERETRAIKLDFACYSPVYSNRHTSAEKKGKRSRNPE